MTWLAAVTTGFGLGLVSFGALWLTVRQLACRPPHPTLSPWGGEGNQKPSPLGGESRVRGWRVLLAAGSVCRLFLVGLALYALSREGADKLLAGLAGLWLARGCVIRSLGGVRHGR